ncbi:hypothetical protein HN777_00580 [Candidatus Woesearchaeota archaeon]|jgi:hypothetical protein|nr:hypothetical protein [Candidatus Woesearchaeota archaeon]
MVQNVFTVTDFDNMLDSYAGRQVSHTPAVRTISNITGQETIADGTPATIKCYFVRTNQKWDFDKAGFMEQGHAIVLAKYADGVVKNDKITADSSKYRVREAYNVSGVFSSTSSATTFTYTVCNLFLEQ